MKILISYLASGWYNITHNYMYALFYGVGTAITFVFILITLQIVHLVSATDPPFVNARRMVFVQSLFQDNQGNPVQGLSVPAARQLFEKTKGVELGSLYNLEVSPAIVNGKPLAAQIGFVDGNYFIINKFDLLGGRAFTEDDAVSLRQLAVVTESFAQHNFKGNALNQHIIIQGVEYTVIGVVKNFSSLLNPHEKATIWLPYTFNKFIPSGMSAYSIYVLFDKGVSTDVIKEQMSRALNGYFSEAHKEVKFKRSDIKTIQEEKNSNLGGNIFTYGAALIVFLLLLIPALNIMTLSMDNVHNRAKEIAVRRAVGATQSESFLQIVVENLMLIIIGLMSALLLYHPTGVFLERTFFVHSEIEPMVMDSSGLKIQTLMLTILLAIVFGGLCCWLPAWVVSRKNISMTLKEGKS